MASPAFAPEIETSLGNQFLQNLRRREIPSLYGLRGAAALTVVLLHCAKQLDVRKLPRLVPGDQAVMLFFELSGLLITWLLIKEKNETGSIHLKKFYERRVLRLFPAFYAMWLICLPIAGVHDRWWAFFYLRDVWFWFPFTNKGPMIFSVAWSLGVEEKFYLVWPWLLRTLKVQRLPLILMCVGIADQIYRAILGSRGYLDWAGYGFDTHLDVILFGCALALAAADGWQPPPWMLRPFTLVASLLVVEGVSVLIPWPAVVYWGTSVASIPLMLILIYVVTKPPRILNNRVSKFFGNISYSLYLYHLPIIFLIGKMHLAHWYHKIPLTMGLATLAATLSYYGVEKPFLRLKDRLHPRQVRGLIPALR